MSFDLSPTEYFVMTKDAWEEFKVNPLSKRHLIAVCTFANHLPEIIAAEYGLSDPKRINNCVDGSTYRAHVVGLCPDAGIVRDLCDYGKHGPTLNRKSVQVQNTGAKEVIVGNAAGISFLGFPVAQKVEKLVVQLKDGTERTAESIVASVTEFWECKFAKAAKAALIARLHSADVRRWRTVGNNYSLLTQEISSLFQRFGFLSRDTGSSDLRNY